MRKAQKRQVEDFVESLRQAHVEIKKAILNKNTLALELLEQCQDGAIRLGTMIETLEGEGFGTVPLLEDYCEIVYQIHVEIQQELPVNGELVYDRLYQALRKVEYSVREDIKVRKEAVFLPYKASMWDSLESVWQAADEDPECDAYVIPIPYYDKNPDGSFREMHYEGGLYPDYVPITRYDAYDFETRKPDLIFIHNPYDECNYVTSVHPYFYSKNLKKFTEKLVYIPYFILSEIDPDNQQAVEGIEHFCTVPAVVNADRVIVQSEDMKKVYVNVLTKETGENTRTYWEGKILGLGSPKLDKVLRTAEEECNLPKEWKRIVLKEDGSRKKVILYNTSVTALLKQEYKMLRKMESVFQTFKASWEDVALLWRPHPLIQATIESMRPQLWLDYQKIVEQFQSEGWGIYDDSVELDRAIALCDAYYGDGSSLVQLCQKAGKPVMIQDAEIV